jgi:hypothetical protein
MTGDDIELAPKHRHCVVHREQIQTRDGMLPESQRIIFKASS